MTTKKANGRNSSLSSVPHLIRGYLTRPNPSTTVIKGLPHLQCDGKLCGCNDDNCNTTKKNWNIDSFDFDENDKTFTIHVDSSFKYRGVYKFQINLDGYFESELTLKFDETRIKEISDPIKIHDVGESKNITIRYSIYSKLLASPM